VRVATANTEPFVSQKSGWQQNGEVDELPISGTSLFLRDEICSSLLGNDSKA
jgi:hypothetical protein